MLSTLQNGKIVKGLSGIPSEGPAVLVGYHMLLGLELGPLFIRFFTEKKIHLRGIAHPFLFNRASERLMPDSASFDSYRLLGAVPVSATNFYKLLSINSFVLLYPGGAREALHRKVLLCLASDTQSFIECYLVKAYLIGFSSAIIFLKILIQDTLVYTDFNKSEKIMHDKKTKCSCEC